MRVCILGRAMHLARAEKHSSEYDSPIEEWNALRGISQSTAFVGVTPGGGLTCTELERRRRRRPVGARVSSAGPLCASMAEGAGGGEWAPSSETIAEVSISTCATMVGRVATPAGGGERGVARGERGTLPCRRRRAWSMSSSLALLSRRARPASWWSYPFDPAWPFADGARGP